MNKYELTIEDDIMNDQKSIYIAGIQVTNELEDLLQVFLIENELIEE